MPTISKEIEFDAGHRVQTHEGKCRSPHGHRYKVRAHIFGRINEDPHSAEYGMLKDFGFLKDLMMVKVHNVLDHSFVVHRDDDRMRLAMSEDPTWKVVVFPYIPTAENVARWVFEQLSVFTIESGFKLIAVEVWETPTSAAAYSMNE